jgi:hypothetical protein
MNQHTPGDWQDLARVWQTGSTPVTDADIQRLHERQLRRLRITRGAELACTFVGVVAALWLALATRFRLMGLLTVAFAVASVYFVLRARREPAAPGRADVLATLDDSLAHHDWLAGQLRNGRVLGFVALFAVVTAASTQLMHMAGATRSGLLATAIAGMAIAAALAWNMSMAWRVWRRSARMRAFRKRLAEVPAQVDRYPQSPAPD